MNDFRAQSGAISLPSWRLWVRFWTKGRPRKRRTVFQDWYARLCPEKGDVFEDCVSGIEVFHRTFSVALNEALEFKKSGRYGPVRHQVAISADLCERFAPQLAGLFLALEQHSQHYGTLPSVDALEPENFRGDAARGLARRNLNLSVVLWGQNNRFLFKLRSLHEITSCSAVAYREAAIRVVEGSSIGPRQDWAALDSCHYDLTTALSEAKVLLKSFLVALPDEEIQYFRERLALCTSAMRTEADRRTATFRRQ